MTELIKGIKETLLTRLNKNVWEHGDCKLSTSFKNDIRSVVEMIDESGLEDDEEITFLTLLELHIENDTILELSEWLCEIN